MSFHKNILEEAKQEVLRNLETKIRTSKTSKTEQDTLYSRTSDLLNQSEMITQNVAEEDVLASDSVNKISESLELDLLTSFRLTDIVSESIGGEMGLHESFINNVSTEIDRISDSLDSLEETLKAKLNPVHYIEGFRTNANFETEEHFYTDRYGESVSQEAKIKYNHDEQNICLPDTVSINTLTGNDVSNATVEISKQVGQNFMKIKNNHNDLDNILDLSGTSFWRETILSNDKLREVSISDDTDINVGAMCELRIKLESVRKINEIILSPYGEYPMSLISVTYTETDNPNELKKDFTSGHPIPEYSNEDTSEEYPLYMDGVVGFKFKDTVVKNIFILFTQTHYTKENMILNRSEALKSDIWNSATSVKEKRVYDSQLLFNPILKENVSALPKAIQNKINSINIESVNDVYTENLFDDDRNMSIEKYAYSYGFYNISANFKDYSNFGIYVSKPISSVGSIKQVKIQTEEYHPTTEQQDRPKTTDIEYYISYKEFPTYLDWTPILPVNKNLIECELLQLQNDSCPLRFPASIVKAVYMHTKKLELNIDYTLKKIGAITYGIYIPNYNFNAIYTAEYIPTEESKVIEYDNLSAPLQNTDRISGRTSNVYILSHYPDTAYPTEITITDANTGLQIKEANKQISCVTNKDFPAESYKSFTKNAAILQYYIHKNMIYFNQSVGPEMVMEIDYYHYVSSVRLKAIIRRNSYDRWTTPVVNKINYNFVAE